MASNFVHLHVHSEYSLLDGAARIKDLVRKAVENKMDSLALTDHGVMYGAMDFYKECKANGIKPILGVEGYVINGDIKEKELGRLEERYHLILLAENEEGYRNLIKLVSESHTEGFYYKPRMNKELLKKYHKGIICLSACLAGEVARLIMEQKLDEAREAAREYKEIFGEDNFFLEVQANTLPEQKMVNSELRKISNELGIKLVATNDIHYIEFEDWKVQDILLCIQTGAKLQDEDRMKMSSNDYYFKSEDEMRKALPDFEDAILNTKMIADRCNVEIEFGHYHLPKYKITTGETSEEFLTRLCEEGLKNRYENVDDKLRERLNYELNTIKQMGFVDYFIIVWDFIKFAKDNGIPVGPGRGSAAGSLVSYVLKITEVDPIKYDLLFERFLNPERVSMPDIDVDFCVDRRSEVIDYVTRLYGEDCVSQIVTFGTMAAKQVIRDVGRVLDIPYTDVDVISKMIPYEMHMTIDRALEENQELKNVYLHDEKTRFLIDTARKLEGLPRHSSTHAAGVVITGEPVSNFVPLAKSEDFVVTQFNMTTIEELGLLKMDFLGLRNLTVINDTVRDIERNYGKKIDILNIDMDDENVYKMISEGKTEGVFQLESKGMTAFMKELEPESIYDIIAGISLYRPGPMDFIPDYIRGKKNKSQIKYDDEKLIPILESTYGCIVYQEQVMRIFRDLAGYSLGRSDLVRRAMSKKKMDVMLKEKEVFINGDGDKVEGAVARGVSRQAAEKIYDKMIDFAKYAFNKSHSACYAVVAYETAWLKYYYPAEFMAALITSVENSQGAVSAYIASSKALGVELLEPDINESGYTFRANGKTIRYALSAVKGIGREQIENLVYERELNGPFTDLYDFISRMMEYGITKKTIENLIKVGALDSLGGKRSQYLAVYILMYDEIAYKQKTSMNGQLNLFDMDENQDDREDEWKLPEIDELSDKVKLSMEKELLGMYVSGHPLNEFRNVINENATNTCAELNQMNDNGEFVMNDNKQVQICGIIQKVNVKVTKKNTTMAFCTLEDMTGEVELICFPATFDRYRDIIDEDQIVMCSGKTNIKEDEGCKIIVQEITPIAELKSEIMMSLYIDTIKDKNLLENIEKTLRRFEGEDVIEIVSRDDNKSRKPKMKVNVSAQLVKEISLLLGDDNVKTYK